MKGLKGFRSHEKDDQKEIDNFVLVVRLYNGDQYNLVANFFTINLPSGRTKDVRA